jgi:hypothetical protein
MYGRADGGEYGTVSAIWNAAYDAGMGAGAIGMGLLTGGIGYPATFLLTAALIMPALIPARRERRLHGRDGRDGRADRDGRDDQADRHCLAALGEKVTA